MVLTNPPFGKKSSVLVVNEEGEQEREALTVVRDDFWATTTQQAAQLRPARQDAAEDQRPRRGRRARQRAVRGRRRRDGPAEAAARVRRPHAAAAARPASSTPRASRRTCCSSTASRPARRRGPRQLWIYDLRTNKHFTLKTNPLKRADLDEFVACYHPANRHERTADLVARRHPRAAGVATTTRSWSQRDKVSLDIFWLRDESLEDSDNLPPPDVIAAEIVEDLRAALEQFAEIQADLTRNT